MGFVGGIPAQTNENHQRPVAKPKQLDFQGAHSPRPTPTTHVRYRGGCLRMELCMSCAPKADAAAKLAYKPADRTMVPICCKNLCTRHSMRWFDYPVACKQCLTRRLLRLLALVLRTATPSALVKSRREALLSSRISRARCGSDGVAPKSWPGC